MIISIGFDHGAMPLRTPVIAALEEAGHSIIDHGTDTAESVDYPDYARLVADDVLNGKSQAGILCCTTGIGMCIAANKIKGIRAAVVHYEDEAIMTRRHNNANILCLGAIHTNPDSVKKIVNAFLNNTFDGGRHERRVCKFTQWELDSGI